MRQIPEQYKRVYAAIDLDAIEYNITNIKRQKKFKLANTNRCNRICTEKI